METAIGTYIDGTESLSRTVVNLLNQRPEVIWSRAFLFRELFASLAEKVKLFLGKFNHKRLSKVFLAVPGHTVVFLVLFDTVVGTVTVSDCYLLGLNA